METIPSKERQPVIEISAATPDDAEGINEVMYEAWLATYPNEEAGITADDIEDRFKDRRTEERMQQSRERLTNILENERRILAKIQGRVVGVSRVTKEEDRNELRSLYVHPEFQGKGVGTALWKAAHAFLDAQKDTFLEVAEYNERAIGFYRGLGFEDTGKRILEERFRMKSGAIIPEMEMRRKADTTE